MVCGVSVLAPAVTLEIPPGRAYELDEQLGPTATPADAPSFPNLLLLDGTVENASSWPIEAARSRFFVVADLQEGLAEARNAATGEGLRLRWDVNVLPHLWVWHEARVSRGRWRSQTELLGIEPAMVPHSMGLDAAIASGHARLVSAQSPLSWWVEAEPLAPA